MFDVGRVCVKIAGRDAGLKCVVVKVLENNYVMIDGETRRRKCNTAHLEPMEQVVEISENASHDHIAKALGIEPRNTKAKPKTDKPKAARRANKHKVKTLPAKKTKESLKKE